MTTEEEILLREQNIINNAAKKIGDNASWERRRGGMVGLLLRKSAMGDGYHSIIARRGYRIKKDEKQGTLVVTGFTFMMANASRGRVGPSNSYSTHNCFVGYVKLKRNYSHVFIRPEVVRDKLAEWLNPIEVDFDWAPKFSSKFYVLTDNEDNLRQLITPKFLQAIEKHQQLEVEIIGNILFCRIPKPVSIQTAVALYKFLTEINDGIH